MDAIKLSRRSALLRATYVAGGAALCGGVGDHLKT
jgi:hypothetical protein